MLQLFRNNQPAVLLLVLLYALLLRGNTLAQPVLPDTTSAGLCARAVYEWLGNDAWWCSVSAFILVVAQAVLLTVMVNQYRITRELTHIPAVCYILLMSSSPSFSQLTPQLMANTFLMLALWELFAVYRRKDAAGRIFNVGVWVAVASLFYYGTSVFVLLGLFALVILRQPDIREFIILVAGFFTVYWLLWVFYFWHNQSGQFFNEEILHNYSFMAMQGSVKLPDLIQMAVIGSILLWSLFSFPIFSLKTGMQGQIYISILYWFLAVSVFSLCSDNPILLRHSSILMIPLAVFLGFNFIILKNKLTAELTHLVLFMAAIAYQYQEYFFS